MIQILDLASTYFDKVFEKVDLHCRYMHTIFPNEHWNSSLHCHPNFEICYIFSGTGKITIGDRQMDAEKGDIFFIPQGVMHTELASFEDPFHIMFLIIDHTGENTEVLHTMFNEVEGRAAIKKPELVKYIFEHIYNEIIAGRPGYLTIVNSKLKELYLLCFRSLSDSGSEHQLTQNLDGMNKHMLLFRKIERFIYHNISQKITIKNMAEYFHYHPKYLSQLIKSETGNPLSIHIMHMRLKRACDYLKYSDVPVTLLVEDLGFLSINSFYKMFKKQMGITPGEYRKRAKKEANIKME